MTKPPNLEGLPLFDGRPAEEPAPRKKARIKGLPSPEAVSGARVLAFPAYANVRLVQSLTDTFLRLRSQHGRRCRDLLLQQHFRPLADRLRRFGVPPAEVRAELEDLEAAIAEAIEAREDYTTTGGHAA